MVEIEASIDNAANANNRGTESDSVQIIDSFPSKKRKIDPNLPTLSALRDSSDFSDITFKVGDQRFFGLK